MFACAAEYRLEATIVKHFLPAEVLGLKSVPTVPDVEIENKLVKAGWQLPARMASTMEQTCWFLLVSNDSRCSLLRRGSEQVWENQ